MADRLTLGIDVGTTSVKAGVIDAAGRVVASFSRPYPTRRSGQSVVEQNPDDWVQLVDQAIAQFVAAGLGDSIAQVGLCSQANTHVFVGADGVALAPAILWQDGRAGDEAARLDAQISDTQKIAWWGAPMPIDASHALARMSWMARHRPEIWQQTRWVMLPKDYCIYKLTGEVCTDPLSNIGLVDNDLNYIAPILDLVPGARDRMAPLVPVTQVAGVIKSGTPLAGRPLVCGSMDAWAGLVGTGGARAKSSVYLSGTSEILGISSAKVIATPGVIVFPQCSGIRLHAAPTQSGGDAARWFADTCGLSLPALSDLIAQTPRSAATPLFLPHLEGERAPLWDAQLRAVFLGMSRRTGLGDLARAVFEGVALSARLGLRSLQASADLTSDRIMCAGGGFRSDQWAQIRADVLGVELHRLAAGEPGVLGAATIAAVGVGAYTGFDQAYDALAKVDRVFGPSTAAHARYDELFQVYENAIAANRDLNIRLGKLGGNWG
jgi:xylulokinase